MTKQTGKLHRPAVSPDGRMVASSATDDPATFHKNAKVGIVPLDGGSHRWISTALDRTFAPSPAPFAGVAGRRTHCCRRRKDRGETHLYKLAPTARRHRSGLPRDPSRSSRSTPPAVGSPWPVDRRAPGRDRDNRWPGHVRDPRPARWEKFSVPTRTAAGRSTRDHAPEGFEARRKYPVRSTCTEERSRSTARRSSTRPRAAGRLRRADEHPPRGQRPRYGVGSVDIGPKHPVAPGTGWGSVDWTTCSRCSNRPRALPVLRPRSSRDARW